MSIADDLKEIFEKMPDAFIPENAADVNAVIQLDLAGNEGGTWHIKITNGQLSTGEGTVPSPDLTLGMDATDYIALTKGEANAMNLFMGGKIKLEGDMGLAMKFQEMFNN